MRETSKIRTIRRFFSFVCLIVCFAIGAPAHAVVPAAKILPDTTCLYISFPDMVSFQASFERTQLGQLAQDPVMKPFAEDFASQLKSRFGKTDIELGLKWDDLKGVYAGEACIARVQPNADANEHAIMMLVNVQGKGPQVARVKQSIASNMTKRKATPNNIDIAGTAVTGYKLERKRGQVKAPEVYYTVFEDQLLVTNHAGLMSDVLKRAKAKDFAGALDENAMFGKVMSQVETDANKLEPHVRWYANPFKFAEVMRASRRSRNDRGKNMAKMLVAQGFDAIRAAGGHLNLATNGYELLHRTFVFAPPVTDQPTKYNAAARMLVFPESKHPVPKWLPRNLATLTSVNWKIKEGFDYSVGLLDEIFETEGATESVLESFEKDIDGPRVDLRNDFMAHLDDHIIIFSDFRMPITTTSERLLVAIRVKDENAVRTAINKLGKYEPQAKPVKIAGLDGWEIISEKDLEEDISDIDLPGSSIPLPGAGGEEDEGEVDDLSLPNAAIVIARGPDPAAAPYLFVSSDVELLQEALSQRPEHEMLDGSDDFKFVNKLLDGLGAGLDSFRSFSRSDEEYRSTYEMIRRGEMPQSESVLGRLLNRILGPDDESQVRKPEFDGSKLPDYQVVRRYLGPSGVFMQPRKNGWAVTGIMISKDQVLNKNARAQQARLTSNSKQ